MLTFFDFRNDIRRLITDLSNYCTIVIFIRREQEAMVIAHLPSNIAYRIIDERKKGAYNLFMEKCFLLFRKIPLTRVNYYLMEEFKIGNIENRKNRRKAHLLLQLHKMMPHVFSYDRYLHKLKYTGNTNIADIDTFLCLTEIYDDYLFSRLIREHKKTFVYVYSWDHACKHTRFSKKVQYMVWNNGIKEDLIQIQRIKEENIHISGSTQLGFLSDFNNNNNITELFSGKPYYYFGCGIGIKKLVEKEIKIIKDLSVVISNLDPDAKLIVRPYPNNKNWSEYDSLLNFTNIVLDNAYRQKDLSVTEDDIMKKIRTIAGAKAFFHVGTTLGLETCFTKCPSFILNTEPDDRKKVNIYNFVNQYQNKKYLIDQSKSNTITSAHQLSTVIKNIEKEEYKQLSSIIRSQFPIKPFDKLSKEIHSLLQ